jgi:hypothetical protein
VRGAMGELAKVNFQDDKRKSRRGSGKQQIRKSRGRSNASCRT